MDHAQVLSFLETVKVGRSCAIAGLTISVVDILHTLPEEVEFYWTGVWSTPRILYFLVRYSSLVEHIWQTIGLAYLCGHSALDNLLFLATEAILIYRIHAVYNSQILLIFIISIFILGGTATLAINFIAIRALPPIDQNVPGVYYCIVHGNDEIVKKYLWADWLPITLFESLLMILATVALVQYRKLRHTRSTLMTTLLRDSILYYTVDASSQSTRLLNCSQQNVQAVGAILPPLLSAAGVRLLSRLRRQDEKLRNGSLPTIHLSSMSFRGTYREEVIMARENY
ncbi:hypothetical protein SISSUDRAFT_1049316 [Sistotremastrum suecicum HHB10207 ss-3]|uniref:DUF6533 domain-containing protein n=1 Tax=Sistotremastrum suecicum HHB10207 ss-3 TaxID=1314776 RepID=A0A166BYM5_9AGAM|nr:hypothetical protein SISSUDRAFT_1049316 [Sistotremastrum suecicum HHB10207 ss-3]